ncbi:aminotransferase family protein [Paenibacillus sp. FSL K6-1230]|uniref:aminotransferase family protein n=1 Tax=Paenibacillus sp. FSL K6-1230 TaxID=2921603 RepID=UPI0030F77D91
MNQNTASSRDVYPVLHPFTYMPEHSSSEGHRFEDSYLQLRRGQGAWVYDEDDQAYLYATTAVPSVGLSRPEVCEAILAQYKTLSFSSTCAQRHGLEQQLASRLLEVCGGHHTKVFYSTDGSGAVEAAMRLARQYFIADGQPKRTKFISLEGGYHGTTFGSGSVTHLGIGAAFGPGLSGCVSVPAPNLYRPPLEGSSDWIIRYCLDQLEEAIFEEGPDEIAAILLEEVQGVNGIVPIPSAYLTAVRDIATKHGILVIMDEVGTGLGRTGYWTSSQKIGLIPDLLVLSKGLTGGYFPMGATLISPQLEQRLFGQGGIFLHGSTQSGHPVGCAAALAVLDIMEKEQVVLNARERGAWILEQLRLHLADHPHVGEIRGAGMMIGIEYVTDHQTKAPADFSLGMRLTSNLRKEGILGNYFNNVLSLLPPLTLTEAEAEQLVLGVTAATRAL